MENIIVAERTKSGIVGRNFFKGVNGNKWDLTPYRSEAQIFSNGADIMNTLKILRDLAPKAYRFYCESV